MPKVRVKYQNRTKNMPAGAWNTGNTVVDVAPVNAAMIKAELMKRNPNWEACKVTSYESV